MDIFLSVLGIFVFCVLFYMNMNVFLYQRAIRGMAIFHQVPVEKFGVLYLKKHRNYMITSKFRWLIIIALFFVSWIPAIICLVINFIVPIIWPEPDHGYKLIIAEVAIDCNNNLDSKTKELLHLFIDTYRRNIMLSHYLEYESLMNECFSYKDKYGSNNTLTQQKMDEVWNKINDKEEFDRYMTYKEEIQEKAKKKAWREEHPKTYIRYER